MVNRAGCRCRRGLCDRRGMLGLVLGLWGARMSLVGVSRGGVLVCCWVLSACRGARDHSPSTETGEGYFVPPLTLCSVSGDPGAGGVASRPCPRLADSRGGDGLTGRRVERSRDSWYGGGRRARVSLLVCTSSAPCWAGATASPGHDARERTRRAGLPGKGSSWAGPIPHRRRRRGCCWSRSGCTGSCASSPLTGTRACRPGGRDAQADAPVEHRPVGRSRLGFRALGCRRPSESSGGTDRAGASAPPRSGSAGMLPRPRTGRVHRGRRALPAG